MSMNIDPKLQKTSAFQIAQRLDAKDGQQDGKISASVWNEFIEGKGGKQIKNFISIENALKSITTYAVREAAKSQESGSANDLAKIWLDAEPPVEGATNVGGSTKTGGTQRTGNTGAEQIAQKIEQEAEELNFEIAPKDVPARNHEDAYRIAGEKISADLKEQLKHDWSPNDAAAVLSKINKDNAAYVVEKYGDNLAADIDNVFGLDEEDVIKYVLKPLFERYTELGGKASISGKEITAENFDEMYKNRSLESLKKDLKSYSDEIIKAEKANDKAIADAKDFNEHIPQMEEQIKGANHLLAEIANTNPKPEIEEGENVDGNYRWRDIYLPDDRWAEVRYYDDGSIMNVIISHDTTPNHKSDGSETDYSEINYLSSGFYVNYDHGNGVYDQTNVPYPEGEKEKIFAYVEKIFGKMPPKSEEE